MNEILKRLRRLPGITGAILAGDDGMLIAAETGLGGRQSEETAAAVVGTLGRSVREALGRLGRGELKGAVLSGPGGRAALVAAGPGYLLATLAPDTNLGLARLELAASAAEAARKIAR